MDSPARNDENAVDETQDREGIGHRRQRWTVDDRQVVVGCRLFENPLIA
jgi:hypothetical protein